jgi:hypothetical protein
MQKTKKVLSVEISTNNSDKTLNYMYLLSLQSRVRFAHTAFANTTPKMAVPYLALPTHHSEKDSKIVIKRMKIGIQKNTIEKKNRSERNATAANERFGTMAALSPQQRQCELGSYYPAGTLVKLTVHQAAGAMNMLAVIRGRQCNLEA